MLSLSTGHDVGYLLGPVGVASGAEGYYTGAVATGEPAGVWWGAGADALGLSGDVDATVMEAVYSHHLDPRDPAAADRESWTDAARFADPHRAFRDAGRVYADLLDEHPHATPEQQEELWGEAQRSARQAVSFVDATFSVQKSITVLGVAFERAAVEAEKAGRVEEAAGWREHHQAVEEAAMVGARAAVAYLQDTAGYGRVGTHGGGGGQWVDSHQWVVAMFRQHDSRDKDPQLHVHTAILNRQLCPDGKWRTLDSKAIHQQRGAAAAVGERASEAFLTETLGVRFETRPDGKAREVVGVDQDVMELFSTRRRAIGPKVAELVQAYTERHGREPSPAERHTIAQEATLSTRKGKASAGEDLAERLDRWERETRAAVGGGLAKVADDVLARRQNAGAEVEFSPADVIARALETVAAGGATWTRSDLMRAVSDALPGHLGLTADEVRPLLESLTDRAIDEAVRITPEADLSLQPAEYRLSDGGDAFARPGSGRYAAHGQLQAERVLRAAAADAGFEKVGVGEVEALLRRYADNGSALGADQAAALRGVMTSGAAVETLVAPAGAGKSFLVGALSEAWAEHGRRVVGLAPSQVAADVMSDEGVLATNVDRWLRSGNDDQFQVGHGDIVVVDEAGMASTAHLMAVHERCQRVGAKMLLVGDPRQLGAVGAGGGFHDLAERAIGYELVEVRRFEQPWEARASLALRDGDLTALADYDRAGRILDGGTGDQAEAKALRAWEADTLGGKQSLLLVGSNEAAGRLSGLARAELVRLGLVPEDGVQLGKDGNTAGVGDLVQARRNEWSLATKDSRAPINRSAYRVLETRDDGGLRVEAAGGDSRPLELPASYVQQHLVLGYASTVHAAQGRTVDRTHSVISGGWDTSLTYVGLTRGREANTAWVVTRQTPEDSPPGQAQEVHPRSGYAVLSDVLERDNEDRTALEQKWVAEELAASTFTTVGQLLAGINMSCRGQTSGLLDRLAADETITDTQRAVLAGDDAMGSVERLLRAAELHGYDREQVLSDALGGRSLASARSPGQVLHHRLQVQLGPLQPVIAAHRDLIPDAVQDYHRDWLEKRADAADERRRELGGRIAQDPPVWALEALGAVPEDPLERVEWEQKAGWAQAYREMAQHESETDPLGAAPPRGLAEKYSIWRTAHEHLGLDDRGPEEGELSEGALRSRVAAYEREKTWAPAAVRAHLGLGNRALAAAETDVALRTAHDDDTVDEATGRVDTLEEQVEDLDEADRSRQAWVEHTADTCEKAGRARAELDARGVDVDEPDGRVTAAEWLEAHEAEQAVEDAHRPIDVLTTDVEEDVQDAAADAAETGVPDIRDTAGRDPSEDTVPDRDTLPSAQRTREAVARAQAAMLELQQRETVTEPDDYDVYDPDTAADEAVDEAVDEMVFD